MTSLLNVSNINNNPQQPVVVDTVPKNARRMAFKAGENDQFVRQHPQQRVQQPPMMDSYARMIAEQKKQEKIQKRKQNLSWGIGIASGIAIIAMAIWSMRQGKNVGNTELGHEIKETFARESKEMWRDISKELGIDDLILSNQLIDNAQSIDNCIKHSSKLKLMGSKPVFSVLLYGPPGTGKTTYATAIAKKYPGSKLAFLDVGTMKDMYHGGSEKKIHAMIDEICAEADKLLKEYHTELAKVIDPKIVEKGDEVAIANAIEAAKKAGKKIPEQKRVFVLADEIDSIMMVDNGLGGKLSNDMLNEFKKGFTDKLGRHQNITVFGCTNLPIDVEKNALKGAGKELDTAMLSRFELKMEVGAPDKSQLLGKLKKDYSKLENSPYISKSLIDGIKGENREVAQGLDYMCELLASNPETREFDFRKLNSIINESPRKIAHEDTLLEFKHLVDVIEQQKANFKISDEDLRIFKEKVADLLK